MVETVQDRTDFVGLYRPWTALGNSFLLQERTDGLRPIQDLRKMTQKYQL